MNSMEAAYDLKKIKTSVSKVILPIFTDFSRIQVLLHFFCDFLEIRLHFFFSNVNES